MSQEEHIPLISKRLQRRRRSSFYKKRLLLKRLLHRRILFTFWCGWRRSRVAACLVPVPYLAGPFSYRKIRGIRVTTRDPSKHQQDSATRVPAIQCERSPPTCPYFVFAPPSAAASDTITCNVIDCKGRHRCWIRAPD